MVLLWAGLALEEVTLLDCFFLIAFFATLAFLLRSVFFARFVVLVLDFACLFLFFLFFDGMVAVYHSGLFAASVLFTGILLGSLEPIYNRPRPRRFKHYSVAVRIKWPRSP